MKLHLNEKGLILPLILGLIAVALVIGLAIWPHLRMEGTSSIYNAPSPSPTTSPKAASKEIEIKELGFKMTLPSGVTDLQYTLMIDQAEDVKIKGKYATAGFSTTALIKADSDSTRCSAKHSPLGLISRYDSTPPAAMSGPSAIKKVGNFYLTFTTPQSPCSDVAAAEMLTLSQIGLLKQAFDSATLLAN